MGDRNNIFFREDDKGNGVYLYSHWCGSELGEALANVLPKAKDRWADPSYATRIIVQGILDHYVSPDQSTGWGLSATLGDGSGRIWVVDFPDQIVRLVSEGDERTPNNNLRSWYFANFDGGK